MGKGAVACKASGLVFGTQGILEAAAAEVEAETEQPEDEVHNHTHTLFHLDFYSS